VKKSFLVICILLFSISLFGCMNTGKEDGQEGAPQENAQETHDSDAAAVANLVEDFGRKLQAVSLQAPKDTLEKSMQENYGAYVSPALLEKWLNDPLNAPGRLTSSPWPERIETKSIEKLSESAYEVQGEIIEVTSAEEEIAEKRQIKLGVEKIDGRWLINSAQIGGYEDSSATVYRNTQYGFSFPLPESWKGYTIVTDEWEGLALGGEKEGEVIETGPIISIRHPQWTSEDPRQDIPIMVFTVDQWKLLQQEKFHIGAAPMGPKELGKNSKYVFALPARYNYAFPTGFEEVEKILEGNPLQANESIN